MRYRPFSESLALPSSENIYNNLIVSDYLSYSYSASGFTDTYLDEFQKIVESKSCIDQYRGLLEGNIVNSSESRAVLHHANRNPSHKFYQELLIELDRVNSFFMEGTYDTIVYVGIGGSYLGPQFLYDSLQSLHSPSVDVVFMANIDPVHTRRQLDALTIERTFFIVVSKSGDTFETVHNLSTIKEYLKELSISADKFREQSMSITQKGSSFDDREVFGMMSYLDEAIGGRFSISSLVGMVLVVLVFGKTVVLDFLDGAYSMDQHSLDPDSRSNMSLMAAVISFYQRTQMGCSSRAVVPYFQSLHYLPAYLQQLICESLGKQPLNIDELNSSSGSLVVGGTGSLLQHSLFQFFHDSPDIVPIQFILFKQCIDKELQSDHDLLNQQCIAQIVSLLKRPISFEQPLRPSTLLIAETFSAETLGALISFYENMVMFEGFLYGINAYDQPAVEFGKELAKSLKSSNDLDSLLASFSNLI